MEDYFGRFGGRYVAEVLRPALDRLEDEAGRALADPAFKAELAELHRDFIGRPTPLLHAPRASRANGGAQLHIKMEGLAHTGAHKINNAVGQALLARRLGKTRVIAETGAGQHGLATAAACARLGLRCRVYMGSVDIARQRPNVFGMEMYGAEVVAVEQGQRTLKDAINEALRDWAASHADTHYLIGSALGPSPYPALVRRFQAVTGEETRALAAERGLDVAALVACVGGGSNAIGFFSPWLDAPAPRLIGAEAGGRGTDSGEHAVRLCPREAPPGRESIMHGYKSRFLVDDDGQALATHSISAGLDYVGVGPQLAALGEAGRVEFTRVADKEALDAVRFFARHEGVLFALESAHAGAAALRAAREYGPEKSVVVHMSGRGDKDLFITARAFDGERWAAFLEDEAAAIRKGNA